MIHVSADSSKVKDESRFLTPVKHGAIKVYMVGAKDTTTLVADNDGGNWNFNIFNGFNPQQ